MALVRGQLGETRVGFAALVRERTATPFAASPAAWSCCIMPAGLSCSVISIPRLNSNRTRALSIACLHRRANRFECWTDADKAAPKHVRNSASLNIAYWSLKCRMTWRTGWSFAGKCRAWPWLSTLRPAVYLPRPRL